MNNGGSACQVIGLASSVIKSRKIQGEFYSTVIDPSMAKISSRGNKIMSVVDRLSRSMNRKINDKARFRGPEVQGNI